MRALGFAVLIGLLLMVSACGGGGGSSDEDDAAAAMSDYLSAFADRDGEAACEHITVKGKGFIADYATIQIPELGTIDCGEVLTQFTEFTTDSQLDALGETADDIAADDVVITGETATVTIPGATVPADLEQEDGEWKVTAETLRRSFATNAQ